MDLMKRFVRKVTGTPPSEDSSDAATKEGHKLLDLAFAIDCTGSMGYCKCTTGCPKGHDPMAITNELAAKHVVLYTVGCEPSIIQYKDFFMGLAHLTGGQYVPLSSAHLLSKVITGGVQEAMDLHQLMAEVNQEVLEEFNATSEQVQEEELTRKVHEKLKSRGARAKKLQRNNMDLPEASPVAQQMSHCADLTSARAIYAEQAPMQQMSITRGISRHSTTMESEMEQCMVPQAMSMDAPRSEFKEQSAPPPVADDYLCTEDDVSEAQVQRMVQQSVMSHSLKSRVNHKY